MQERIQGTAWKFGDNINTDIISPPQFMELSIPEAARYTMQAVNPDFASQVKAGDLFVAQKNLGSGSSRETSPLTLKHLGIKAVIAQSFARIFYRNCINLGIPAIECDKANKIEDQDEIALLLDQGKIINLTRNETYTYAALPDNILAMIATGGLVPYLLGKHN